MRKIAYQLLIASLFVAVLAPLAAWAQTEDHLKVDVPFQFRAGNTLLPAGKYLVEPVDESEPNVLVFRGINNHAVAIVPTLPTERSTYPDKSDLKFDKVGNQEVLTKIWVGGQEQGLPDPRKRRQDRDDGEEFTSCPSLGHGQGEWDVTGQRTAAPVAVQDPAQSRG